MPYFGARPQARANLLGQQPRSSREKTEHWAPLRKMMHTKKTVDISFDTRKHNT